MSRCELYDNLNESMRFNINEWVYDYKYFMRRNDRNTAQRYMDMLCAYLYALFDAGVIKTHDDYCTIKEYAFDIVKL